MPWAKLDDGIVDNLKTLSVWSGDPAAFALDIRAIAWSAKQLTNGFVPTQLVAAWFPAAEQRARLVDLLIASGRWEVAEQDGWLIHDFLDYNPSREEIEAERDAKQKAGRKGGKASGRSRRQKAGEK